jgi:transcriptional regulator with XRE-family HTH domain
MAERPRVEVEAQHYAGVLRQAIRAAGLSVSEVERRLGAGPQTLRRVFGGTTDLKIKHLLSVLRIIGMSQAEFFAIAARAARRRQQRSAGGELLATFELIGYPDELVPLADDAEMPRTEEELARQIDDAVQRVLERRAGEARGPLAEPPPAQDEEEGGDGGGDEPE